MDVVASFRKKIHSYLQGIKLALYVNASGSCDSASFFEITDSVVPGNGKFNSDTLVNFK